MISIICPIYNEERHIAKCIDSILAQDYPHDDMEVLLVDGMSVDKTREVIAEYQKKYSFIKLLDNIHRTVPYAMNIGIKESVGDVIIRLDAHAVYPKSYFMTLIPKLQEHDADNVGGICCTLPANEDSKSKAIAEALSCSFGMGNSYFRIGISKEIQVDTVPFGCFRRNIFDKIGMFDEELTRNQDDEFNGRIVKNGGKIYLIPSLVISYTARDSIQKMCNMYYQYGLFKPLVNQKLGSPATLRQFFPPLFLVGLIAGAILSMFSTIIQILYFSVVLLYLCLGVFFGIKAAKKHARYSLIFLMPFTFLLIHVSYGWGYLRGIYKILTKQSFNVDTNR